MKTTTKLQLFSALVLISSLSINAMDKLRNKKPKKQALVEKEAFALKNWAIVAGNVILKKLPIETIDIDIKKDKEFIKLSPITQTIIIDCLTTGYNTKSIEKASDAIRKLIDNSEQMKAIINDSSFCFPLIKHYARKFRTNDATVCNMLRIPCTQSYFNFQKKFLQDFCINPAPDISQFKEFLSSGIDLYFTDNMNYTPAELCIIYGNTEGLKMLLNLGGVDPEFIGMNKFSLYNLAVQSATMNAAAKETATIKRILENALDEKMPIEKEKKCCENK